MQNKLGNQITLQLRTLSLPTQPLVISLPQQQSVLFFQVVKTALLYYFRYNGPSKPNGNPDHTHKVIITSHTKRKMRV